MSTYVRIFVGLGGFGSSVVQKLYKIVKKENNGNVPPYLRFAAYDSAMHEKPKQEDFPNAVDFMKASSDGPQEFLISCRDKYADFRMWWPGLWQEKDEKNLWWNSDLIWSGRGLGQYRPFGRLGFFKHLTDQPNNIIELINNELNEAAHATKTAVDALTPRIIIVNSLAGGTGSSAFIDVANLIKEKISRINASFEIILFTVTGEASMKGRANETSDAYKWALENSYAALTELNYWEDSKSSPLVIEYPRYGLNNGKIPAFRHVGIFCQDNMSKKNLPSYKDYIDFLADTLNVLTARVISNTNFDSVFDNIVSKMKRWGSYGMGSIHYRYKDALLYQFSLMAEEGLTNNVLRPYNEEVKKDIEKDIEKTLNLYEESYYSESISNLNRFRKDNVFDLLEHPYEDERRLTVHFPFITLAKLEAKINHDNIQHVLRSIKSLDSEIIQFLDERKKKVYETIRSALKTNLFFGQQNNSLSYIREYLTQIKMTLDSRVIGLEKDIPEVFEKTHLKQVQQELYSKSQYLEKKQNKKALEEFRDTFRKYYEVIKLVLKSKAKVEIYKNLSKQIEWYINAVNEVLIPTEKSLLKHYRYVNEAMQLGTYDEQYKKDQFTIYAFPLEVKEIIQKNKDIYNDFSLKNEEIKKSLINRLSDRLTKTVVEGTNGIPSLLELYKTQPIWIDETSLPQSNPSELSYDKREELKNSLKRLFRGEMEGDFAGYMKNYLPQNVVEALYQEARVNKRPFKDFLDEKLKELDKLVDPFVILGESIDKSLEERSPFLHLILSKNDFNQLFQKYGSDKEVYAEDIKEEITLGQSKQQIMDGILKDNKSLVDKANLEKATLLKGISGFKLEEVSVYNNIFKAAYDNKPKLESFADIRLKPGKSTKEILFLLAEYYNVIEVTGGKFYKYDGKTLEKGLSGRGETIKWFIEERNTSKAKTIKNKLKTIWNKVPNSDKKGIFEEVIQKLELKKKKVKDEGLYEIFEENIKTMQHAVDFKYYETIQKEFE